MPSVRNFVDYITYNGKPLNFVVRGMTWSQFPPHYTLGRTQGRGTAMSTWQSQGDVDGWRQGRQKEGPIEFESEVMREDSLELEAFAWAPRFMQEGAGRMSVSYSQVSALPSSPVIQRAVVSVGADLCTLCILSPQKCGFQVSAWTVAIQRDVLTGAQQNGTKTSQESFTSKLYSVSRTVFYYQVFSNLRMVKMPRLFNEIMLITDIMSVSGDWFLLV